MRCLFQLGRVRGNLFVEPGRAEGMIAQADLGLALPAFETQLHGRNESEKRGVVQKSPVRGDPLRAHVGAERRAEFLRKQCHPRSLTRITAAEAKEFFKQMTIPLPAALARSQIVEDDPPDHCFVQMFRDLCPGTICSGMRHGVAATLGEGGKCGISNLAVPPAQIAQGAPKIGCSERSPPVVGHQGRDLAPLTQQRDFPQQQGAQLERGDASGKTVPSQLDPEGRTASQQDPHGMMVHKGFDLGRPIIEVLNFVEEQEGRLAGGGCFIERPAQNLSFEPTAQLQNRLPQSAK